MAQGIDIITKLAYIEKLTGEKYALEIPMNQLDDHTYSGTSEIDLDGYKIIIQEEWKNFKTETRIKRKIVGTCQREWLEKETVQGIRIWMTLPGIKYDNEAVRIVIPSMVYTRDVEDNVPDHQTFMEDRLTDPMILLYEKKKQEYVHFSLQSQSDMVTEMVREKGQSRYLHKTQNVSVGYRKGQDTIDFEVSWPYEEADKSSALNISESPATAFYPLDGDDFEKEITIKIKKGYGEGFAHTLYEAYEQDAREKNAELIHLEFTKEESRQYRMHSLGKTYREFENDGAGFFFHFDPKYGYDSRPSGFSTCYDTIPHNSYTHILEYGFTGRQINAAYIMATEKGGIWLERGEKVIEFFLKHCQKENGWLYSLFDLNTGQPFYSFGDPDAPKLHYISKTSQKGNYLRTMTEPMNDCLECYQWYKKAGRIHKKWKEACLKFADFLKEVQNKDGSWYRAYCPDGTGTDSVDRPDMDPTEREKGQKAVTAIPLVFLCNLCRMLEQEGEDSSEYLNMAKRGGDYVCNAIVKEEHYQGATLDNPNQVDKEASQYVMAGLWHLYSLTKEEKYLNGAENAAYIFMTWNYIWNAPMQAGNILCEKGFKTKGMGAINSVWGGGVVDIYSLFHIRELYLIGQERNHSFMCEMAEWIATATAQILSYPKDDMGFADIGMQPEGFGICPQGIDEGMIHKGDIWGTLGWIYSAGIYGLKNYLMTREEKEHEEKNS